MRTFGNIIWHFPFLGFLNGAVTWLIGLLFVVTVVGAPIGLGLMELGKFYFAPFGRAMVRASDIDPRPRGTAWRVLSIIATIVYIPFGLILAAVTVVQVGLLFVTIIGIPAGVVIAKSLSTWFNPVGKKCVSIAVAEELERRKAAQQIQSTLGPTAPAN